MPMNKEWALTQESFDALLAWLDPDREVAGRKYEEIRRGLIKVFTCNGCHEPEDLADATINRVSSKLKDIKDTYEGQPYLFFYGVAKNILREYWRRKPPPPPPQPPDNGDEIEQYHLCLERCMKQLTPHNRELVLEYYKEEKRAKIDHRKKMAERLGIALNALRIRVYRFRAFLEECVRNCLREATI